MDDQLEMRNPHYWKPGDPKPSSSTTRKPKKPRKQSRRRDGERNRGGGNAFRKPEKEHRSRVRLSDSPASAATAKSSKHNAGLSNRTQSMKFMARKRIAADAKRAEEERRKELEATHWVVDGAGAGAGSSKAPRLLCVRDSESAFFKASQARKSYGSFNPSVENMSATLAGNASAEKHGISKEDMADRYQKYVASRPAKRQRRKK